MSDAESGTWARFDPGAIPTKTSLLELEAFLQTLPRGGADAPRVLDLGCGTGAVTARLRESGFDVVGVDINAGAIEAARRLVPTAAFYVRDVAAAGGLDLGEPLFGAVVCQLVVSVVGPAPARRALVANAFELLEPGGRLYVSASGISADVNPAYARLYERDFPRTGERGTYFSRDAEGKILYITHHFEEEELRRLLEESGFQDVAIARKLESSSRRPDEAAYFLYARGRRPLG